MLLTTTTSASLSYTVNTTYMCSTMHNTLQDTKHTAKDMQFFRIKGTLLWKHQRNISIKVAHLRRRKSGPSTYEQKYDTVHESDIQIPAVKHIMYMYNRPTFLQLNLLHHQKLQNDTCKNIVSLGLSRKRKSHRGTVEERGEGSSGKYELYQYDASSIFTTWIDSVYVESTMIICE